MFRRQVTTKTKIEFARWFAVFNTQAGLMTLKSPSKNLPDDLQLFLKEKSTIKKVTRRTRRFDDSMS